MTALRRGKSVHVLYETRFLINWPEQLGGGTVIADVDGSMLMVPMLSMP